MHATDCIAPEILPLSPGDDMSLAAARMDELRLLDMPVVANGRLLGMVKEEMVMADPSGTVGNRMDSTEVPYVRPGQHIYDVVKLIMERGLGTLPVVDLDGVYIGAVSERSALAQLATLLNVSEPGSVLVLEMNQIDYSLQQIARIVEGNDARVLNLFCHTPHDSTRMLVTLKINREDVSAVLQTFERFEYTVKTTFQGSQLQDGMRGRFDELMRIIDL